VRPVTGRRVWKYAAAVSARLCVCVRLTIDTVAAAAAALAEAGPGQPPWQQVRPWRRRRSPELGVRAPPPPPPFAMSTKSVAARFATVRQYALHYAAPNTKHEHARPEKFFDFPDFFSCFS